MMPQKIRIMDEEDLELVGVLISLGVRRNLAAAIVYLCRNREATSRQIEVATNLSQPEISLAMGAMREIGWTEERNITAPRTGRPQKSYKLRAPLEEILATMRRRCRTNLLGQRTWCRGSKSSLLLCSQAAPKGKSNIYSSSFGPIRCSLSTGTKT
jgi:predicted transcriptional regulator